MLWAFAAPALKLMKMFSWFACVFWSCSTLSSLGHRTMLNTGPPLLLCCDAFLLYAVLRREAGLSGGLSLGLSCQAIQIHFIFRGMAVHCRGLAALPIPLSPFLFDLLHLSSAVPRSLLELPPHRPGPPLDRERDTEKMEKILRVGEALPRTLSQAQTPSRAGGIAEQGTPSTDKTPALKHKDKRQRERLSSF